MSIKPVIVVVAYNRAKSMLRLLDSIENAKYPSDDILLIISIDYNPHNNAVIEAANSFIWSHGEKIVRTHISRMGLKQHVLECGDYTIKYGCVIVLEDDLIVSADFYNYAIASQEYYADDSRIAGVALYCNEWNNFAASIFRPMRSPFDSYFRQVCESWGQSWTYNQWQEFRNWMSKKPQLYKMSDMPNQVYIWPETSWGKYFSKYVTEKNLFLIIPYVARSTCFSEIGQHTDIQEVCNQVCLMNGIPMDYRFPKFEEGVHYDMFFENIDLKKSLSKWIGNDDCTIDIYGLHETIENRYLLTTKSLPYRVVHSFGLEMRPYEQNVMMDISGESIWLYDTKEKGNNPKTTFRLIDYNLSGYEKRSLKDYTIKIYKNAIQRKINRLMHKITRR